MSTKSTFKIGLCQVHVGEDKKENLQTARSAVEQAVQQGATVVSLPECFNCPYSTASFPEYCEPAPSTPGTSPEQWEHSDRMPSAVALAHMARDFRVTLIGGSIPERDEETQRIYNTCLVFSPEGKLLAKHRKVHLFDIDVPGRITFKESDTLSPGHTLTVFDTEHCKIGVAICYDIRFPELAMLYRAKGAKLIIYPGAFNMTTGPAHWELLQRARAVDNQVFVATTSPARNPDSSYQAWGHSTLVDPWGTVLATTEHKPAVVVAEIDLNRVEEVRSQIPVLKQKRTDLYAVQDLQSSNDAGSTAERSRTA